jgi:xylulokinase
MDPARRVWSSEMAARMGVAIDKLPPIRDPREILGRVTDQAAQATGLRAGTPVLVGGADYPMALLGSGACRAGLASDVTGTSCFLTLIADQPLLDPEICNVLTIEGHWGPFVLLESGGDAMRWARRAFHENNVDYATIVSHAADAPPGAGALFFLPYLAGERLGQHRNARAQYFGLGAGHGLPHLHRAVMEGVAFAAARHLRIMEQATGRPIERVIASGGGSKTALWLKIKASIYGVPVIVPREAECGIVGCAALAQTALGKRASLDAAVDALVAVTETVAPDPAWTETYARMQPVFDLLYRQSQNLYDQLDAIAS